MNRTVTVFCSSSSAIDPYYIQAARDFVRAASAFSYRICCGGTDKGLMRVLCESGAAYGVPVTGIVPEFFREAGLTHPLLSRTVYTADMAERKRILREGTPGEPVDAIVAFPGGIGTLDEFIEALVLKSLGRLSVPLILLDLNGFYRPLLDLLRHYAEAGMLAPAYREFFSVADCLDALFEILNR